MRIEKKIYVSLEQNTAIIIAPHIDEFNDYVVSLIAADFEQRGLKFSAKPATGDVLQPEYIPRKLKTCAREGCRNRFAAQTGHGGREQLYCSPECKRKANFATWYAQPGNAERHSKNVVARRKK